MEITYTLEDIKRAQSDKDDKWKFGNDRLYQLCHDQPKHEDDSIIIAKIWLIGRAYAAPVERRKRKGHASFIRGDPFYEQCVAPVLKESELDAKIDELSQYASIEEDAIVPILGLHQHLVVKLGEITHDLKHSLASKYLHFHLPPLFYIYDNNASQMLNKLLPRHTATRKVPGNYDAIYQAFFLKMLDLRDKIHDAPEFGQVLTPRELDRLLRNLWYASQQNPGDDR